jgi:hypothetical protein
MSDDGHSDAGEDNPRPNHELNIDVATEAVRQFDDVMVHHDMDEELRKIRSHECNCLAFRKGSCMKKLSSENSFYPT